MHTNLISAFAYVFELTVDAKLYETIDCLNFFTQVGVKDKLSLQNQKPYMTMAMFEETDQGS